MNRQSARAFLGLRGFGFRLRTGKKTEPVRIGIQTGWPKVARKWPRDINEEMFTKRVAMRAVELSIGAFCTEFRCEQLCDDDIFLGSGSTFGAQDRNTEMVMKIVTVGAVTTAF